MYMLLEKYTDSIQTSFIFGSKTFFLPFTCVHFCIKITSWNLTLSLTSLFVFLKIAVLLTGFRGKSAIIVVTNTTWWLLLWHFCYEIFRLQSPLKHKDFVAFELKESEGPRLCEKLKATLCVLLPDNTYTACIWVSERTSEGEDHSSADSQNCWVLPGKRVRFWEVGF